jgi:SAM-dependent methyltransferase
MSAADRILNLGSGGRPMSGAVNVDASPLCAPDLVHDLRTFPWPLESDTFDRVWCQDVLEHLPDTVRTMEEIHRVCRDGASVTITTPHFSCANAYTDPTHCHYFGAHSFEYFTDASAFPHYSKTRYSVARRTIAFHHTLPDRLVRRLANRWPTWYERHLCWIVPAWFIEVVLTVEKSSPPEPQLRPVASR